MIRNERQYKVTRQRTREFEDAIAKFQKKARLTDWDRIQLDALNRQLADLKDEIAEYDRSVSTN